MNVLIVSILAFVAVCPNFTIGKHSHKDGLSGFSATRGKRSSDSNEASNSLAKDDIKNESHSIGDLSVSPYDDSQYFRDARMPSQGFQGMRGKKDMEISELEKRQLSGFEADDNVNELPNNDFSYLPKRAPAQGFFGMRGKKFFFDWYGGKRAPMGFMGMRGKKNEDDPYSPNAINQQEYDTDFYENLQNERKLLTDLLKSQNDIDLDAYLNKRAPSQGFMGMRGKKYFDSEWDSIQDQIEKRAPVGFMGMRGKKSVSNNDYYISDKRLPQGFLGMRGKKSIDNDEYNELEKRAPMGFQGMRGKKTQTYVKNSNDDIKRAPIAGFFGMRGKKQPMIPDGSLKQMTMNANEFDMQNQLIPSHTAYSDLFPIKRLGPSGFMGMRGRKW